MENLDNGEGQIETENLMMDVQEEGSIESAGGLHVSEGEGGLHELGPDVEFD